MVKKNNLKWDAGNKGKKAKDSDSDSCNSGGDCSDDSDCSDDFNPDNFNPDDFNIDDFPEVLKDEKPELNNPIEPSPVIQEPVPVYESIAPNINESVDIASGLANIKFPCNIIIAGQTDTGKTNLVKLLVRRYATSFNRIILLSPTANLQGVNFLQEKFIIKDVTPGKVEKIIAEQEKNKNWKTLLIFDDCIGSMSFKNSSVFDKLASSGRHYNTTIIHIVQDLNKLSPCIRDNSKYLFITLCKEHQLKTCFQLSTGFESFNQFKDYMKSHCKNYQIVRFNLSGDSETPHLTFKSEVSPKFRIEV